MAESIWEDMYRLYANMILFLYKALEHAWVLMLAEGLQAMLTEY